MRGISTDLVKAVVAADCTECFRNHEKVLDLKPATAVYVKTMETLLYSTRFIS
jgi:hypothetical protein